MDLGDLGTVTLPEGARVLREAEVESNYDEVTLDKTYDLHGKELLVVVYKPEDRPCTARLRTMAGQYGGSTANPGVETALSVHTFAGHHPALFAEMLLRRPRDVKEGRPARTEFHYFVCTARGSVSLAYSDPMGSLDAADRDLLHTIAATVAERGGSGGSGDELATPMSRWGLPPCLPSGRLGWFTGTVELAPLGHGKVGALFTTGSSRYVISYDAPAELRAFDKRSVATMGCECRMQSLGALGRHFAVERIVLEKTP